MVKKCVLRIHGPLLIVIVYLVASTSAATWAQEKGPDKLNSTATPVPAQESTTKPPQTSQPISSAQAVYLVRSILMTLNDANRCGNYTVLRDLAAPDFQAKNSPADLAQSFADLRRRNFDLFAVALLPPQFTAGPTLDSSGRLRLTGFFPTRPLRINFDLTFQSVGGQWRLFTVSVATPQAPATQSQLDRRLPRRSSGLFYGLRILAGTAGWRW